MRGIFDHLESQQHGGEVLSEAVVQISRKPASLRLLAREELLQQFPPGGGEFSQRSHKAQPCQGREDDRENRRVENRGLGFAGCPWNEPRQDQHDPKFHGDNGHEKDREHPRSRDRTAALGMPGLGVQPHAVELRTIASARRSGERIIDGEGRGDMWG